MFCIRPKPKKINNKVFGWLLMSLLLCGCGAGDMDDLEAFIKNTKAKKQYNVKELPVYKPYESFAYVAENRRDPFTPSIQTEDTEILDDNGIRPDPDRRKEELESYSLDSIGMVGTLKQNEEIWGLVKSPSGTVHRVKPDNYLGQNYGRIIGISATQIDMIEIVPNGMGGWKEREASIALTE